MLASLLALAMIWTAGCGGGKDPARQASTPSPSPTRTATEQTSTGVDAARINRARDRVVGACGKLTESAGDEAALRTLRRAARTYVDAFEAAPDEPFRRGPNSPEITMRQLLRATGAYVRNSCGGGEADSVADRLSERAADNPAG